ncbi:GAF and ANTAR domain-containing protein [soil metagenome]
MDDYPPLLNASIHALAGLLLPAEGLDDVLARISSLSVATVEGCDYAGVSLVEPNALRTVGETADIVRELDLMQYEIGEGPCVSAIREADKAPIFEIGSMSEDSRWPAFSERAMEKGVSSLLAHTLGIRETGVLGALNLYARRPHAFRPEDGQVATVFATHAAIALANARGLADATRRVRELEEGIASRDIIGQAKGILMERERCTDDEAFAILTRVSQHLNRKLRDVAQDVIQSSRPRPK